ncbi:MAG: ATP-binding protein [Defluviitaleaceae bacterium]|nr:ATP-binding protein [Defluviitaleaceae bacterium]
MRKILQIVNNKRTLVFQIFFTAIAFSLLVILSYNYVFNIVEDYMSSTTSVLLDFGQTQLEAGLEESWQAVEVFADTISLMFESGHTQDEILHGIRQVYYYAFPRNYSLVSSGSGFFGYLHFDDESVFFTTGVEVPLPACFVPSERPWYLHALQNPYYTGVMVGPSYIDIVTENSMLSLIRNIHAPNGERIGAVALDIKPSGLSELIATDGLGGSENSIGIVLDNNMYIIAFHDTQLLGTLVWQHENEFQGLVALLEHGEQQIFGHELIYEGIEYLLFSRVLYNGWVWGILVPSDDYFGPLRDMMYAIIALATILWLILIVSFIYIDEQRTRADKRSHHKTVFLANMSHEIRTPINAIIGMTMIGKGTEDTDRKNYCLTKIETASRHLLGLINDILDISKIEANKLELFIFESNLKKVIHQVANICKFRAEEKQQEFKLSIDPKVPSKVLFDELRLTQVLTNLLMNAIKFTPENGKVSLSIGYFDKNKDGKHTIYFQVKDTGIGISPEQQSRIFDDFAQAESSTTRRFGGTGLGLSISQQIIKLMGGTIEVKSAIGKGTTFSFTILMESIDDDIDTADENISYEAGINGVFAGKKILLVEDVDINREIVITLLENTGVQIDIAQNGIYAVEAFINDITKYDLILMDIQMPEMDGYQATKAIRGVNHVRAIDIPILAMTANVFKEDIENCLAVGMNGHLGKPIDLDALIESLKKYLK